MPKEITNKDLQKSIEKLNASNENLVVSNKKILESIDILAFSIKTDFNSFEKKFDRIDKRFDRIDKTLFELLTEQKDIKRSLASLEKRMNSLSNNVEGAYKTEILLLKKRLKKLETLFQKHTGIKIEQI